MGRKLAVAIAISAMIATGGSQSVWSENATSSPQLPQVGNRNAVEETESVTLVTNGVAKSRDCNSNKDRNKEDQLFQEILSYRQTGEKDDKFSCYLWACLERYRPSGKISPTHDRLRLKMDIWIFFLG